MAKSGVRHMGEMGPFSKKKCVHQLVLDGVLCSVRASEGHVARLQIGGRDTQRHLCRVGLDRLERIEACHPLSRLLLQQKSREWIYTKTKNGYTAVQEE